MAAILTKLFLRLNRFLSKLQMHLPAERTLRKWTEDFHFQPGINASLLKSIHHLTSSLDTKERDCVLVWDEMAIKELIEYDKGTDGLEGIQNLGSQGKSLDVANEALVFMAQGINSKWKFPISFYFTCNATKTEDLEKLVRENISALRSIGLRVRMCICDMAFTNQSLYNRLGISEETPYSMVQNEKVYFVHDTPHLVKLIRNNLLKYDFYLTRRGINVRTKRQEWITDRVRWLHLSTFFTKDRRLTTRLAPRLTAGHLFLRDYAKMRVKLATQLMSRTVYAGIMTMIKLKLMKQEAKATGMFVKQVDDLFDLLNISKYSDDKPSRCASALFKNLQRFDEHLKFLNSITIPKYPHKTPEFLKGLKITVNGIKMLCNDLKAEGYQYVLTRHLQQDCLENFFAAMRMKGGFSRNPSARQFRSNFKYLFLAGLLKTHENGNTEGNQGIYSILEFVKSDERIVRNSNSEKVAELSEANNSNFLNLKCKRRLKFGAEQGKAAITYFAPVCIKMASEKSKCKQCALLLKAVSQDSETDFNLFTRLKSDGKLLSVDNSTMYTFTYLNENFDAVFHITLSKSSNDIAKNVFESITKSSLVQEWLNADCKEHRTTAIMFFIRAKIFRLVKDKNETVKKVKSWNQTRRDLRNQ